MGAYETALYDYINSQDFVRTFRGKCPECGAEIWSVAEKYDLDKKLIKAKFVCNCGKTSAQTVFSQKNGYKYRYPQGIAECDNGKASERRMIIKQVDCYYEVTPEKVIKHNYD